MFRLTQELSSASRPVLKLPDMVFVLVGVDAVNVMVAYQPVMRAYVSQWSQFLHWFESWD